MSSPLPPFDPAKGLAPPLLRGFVIAQVVARNVVPLAGVLFLGWHAASVLLLYFIDTMLAIGVIVAGLMAALPRYDPTVQPIGLVRTIAASVFLLVFLSVPLGIPLVIMFSANDVNWRELLADPGLRIGAIMQAAAAIWGYVAFSRELSVRSPEALRVKRRFALVFLRWVGVLMVMFTSLGIYFPVLVIATYVAISIWEEIAPDSFLSIAGDNEDLDAAKRTAAMPGPAPRPRGRLRKSRHRHS